MIKNYVISLINEIYQETKWRHLNITVAEFMIRQNIKLLDTRENEERQ